MRILLTNDDGILAPGIAAMYRELIKIGDVTVAAPDSVQSASSHGITIDAPLTAMYVHANNIFEGWAVAGRPADCVKLAVSTLVDEPPDLVVSGINDGANVAVHVLYSGTVAAAAEGAILGIPSVAVSQEWGDHLDFDRAARIAASLIGHYAAGVANAAPSCRLLNINIPDLGKGKPYGVKVARQAIQRVNDRYDCETGPGNIKRYFLRGTFADHGPPESDLRALRDGYVVLTPLHFDLTEHERMEAMAGYDWPDVRDV